MVQPAPTLTPGFAIRPENIVRIDGTINMVGNHAYGYSSGGTELGLVRSIDFNPNIEYASVDDPTFGNARLIEVVSEDPIINIEIYEFNWNILQRILPSNINTTKDSSNFFMSSGGSSDVIDGDLFNMVIELYGCDAEDAVDLDNKVRGMFITFHKLMLTNPLELRGFTPKSNLVIPLEFRATRDHSQAEGFQLFTIGLF